MNFKALKCIGLVLGITLTTAYAADSEYWQEFEAKGVPLMQHIQDLAAVSERDSADVRDHRKNALAYFFATGGKNGFRQEPVTPDEYDILVKALAVTTILHDSVDGASVLDLVQVRRNYRLITENALVQRHLVCAQALIAHTLWIQVYYAPGIIQFISSLKYFTANGYVFPLNALSPKPTQDYLKAAFVDVLTLAVVQAIVPVISPTHGSAIKQNSIREIKQLVEQNFSIQTAASIHRPDPKATLDLERGSRIRCPSSPSAMRRDARCASPFRRCPPSRLLDQTLSAQSTGSGSQENETSGQVEPDPKWEW